MPLLSLVDEFDDADSKNRDARAITLSRASGWRPVGVPFKHLVVVVQIARFDRTRTLEILRSNGYGDVDAAALDARIAYARRWLERFAPEEIKFRVADALPPEAASLDAGQKEFLARLAARLRPGQSGEQVHALVYEVAKSLGNAAPGHLFQAIYLALAGKPQGPRAGAFIAFVGHELAARRFEEASR